MTAAERIVQLMAQLAKEEEWMDHYSRVGIAAPKTEENIAALRAELQDLRAKVGMRS